MRMSRRRGQLNPVIPRWLPCAHTAVTVHVAARVDCALLADWALAQCRTDEDFAWADREDPESLIYDVLFSVEHDLDFGTGSWWYRVMPDLAYAIGLDGDDGWCYEGFYTVTLTRPKDLYRQMRHTFPQFRPRSLAGMLTFLTLNRSPDPFEVSGVELLLIGAGLSERYDPYFYDPNWCDPQPWDESSPLF
jgi:hypothetical protein